MKKLLLVAFLASFSAFMFASMDVESNIYPSVTASYTISANVVKTCSINAQAGFLFIQNVSSVNIWVSPFKDVVVGGAHGGFKMLPDASLYWKPLGIHGPTYFDQGSVFYAIAESGSSNVLSGWYELY